MEEQWNYIDYDGDLKRTYLAEITKIHNFWIDHYLQNSSANTIRILDAGCGKGRLLRYYSEKNLNIIGIEKIHSIAATTKKEFPRLKILNADTIDIPFKNESIDIYLSVGVLRWLPIDDSNTLFTEANRVLKRNGIIILDTHVIKPFWAIRDYLIQLKIDLFKKNEIIKKPMEIEYSINELILFFKNNHFKIIKTYRQNLDFFVRRIQKNRFLSRIILEKTNIKEHPYIFKKKWRYVIKWLLSIIPIRSHSVVIVAKKQVKEQNKQSTGLTE
jgi:SAM-dependent methyltransferase